MRRRLSPQVDIVSYFLLVGRVGEQQGKVRQQGKAVIVWMNAVHITSS